MSEQKYYTGVGTSKAPLKHLTLFALVAEALKEDHILRSCEENGSCSAFREGSAYEGEMFIPWEEYNGSFSSYITSEFDDELIKKAESICLLPEISPEYSEVEDKVKKVMVRNVFSLLGADLNSKSKFMIYYTPKGELSKEDCVNTPEYKTGLTAHQIKIAEYHNIPRFNSAKEEHFDRLLGLANDNNSFYKKARRLLWDWLNKKPVGIPDFTQDDAKKVLLELEKYKKN